jgi:DNA-binding MarR family transcriptional regulator
MLMAHTKDRIGLLRDRTLAEYGINKEEFAILYAIQAIEKKLNKNATPSLITKCLVMSPHAISQIVTRMQKRGLVNKYDNKTGRKSVTVKATKKGLAVWKEALKYRESIDKMMDNLSDEERQFMWNSLIKLRQAVLKETGVVYSPLFPDLLGFKAKKIVIPKNS